MGFPLIRLMAGKGKAGSQYIDMMDCSLEREGVSNVPGGLLGERERREYREALAEWEDKIEDMAHSIDRAREIYRQERNRLRRDTHREEAIKGEEFEYHVRELEYIQGVVNARGREGRKKEGEGGDKENTVDNKQGKCNKESLEWKIAKRDFLKRAIENYLQHFGMIKEILQNKKH